MRFEDRASSIQLWLFYAFPFLLSVAKVDIHSKVPVHISSEAAELWHGSFLGYGSLVCIRRKIGVIYTDVDAL